MKIPAHFHLYDRVRMILILSSLLCLPQCRSKTSEAFSKIIVEKRSIKATIQTTGTVEPMNKVEIQPPVAGRIDSILVEEGRSVSKGEIIAWMSSTSRAALLDIARTRGEEELQKWKEKYLPTPIVVPVNGLIVKKRIVPGQFVAMGAILFELSDKLIVRAQVDETDIGKILLNMVAEFTVDAFPNHTLQGKVVLISEQAELVNNVNIYEVEIAPVKERKLEQDIRLRSGMTANIDFVLFQTPEVLVIPTTFVDGRENDKVEMFNDKKDSIQILLGRSDGQFVEILSGAILGDTLLTKNMALQEQAKKSSPLAFRRPGAPKNKNSK